MKFVTFYQWLINTGANAQERSCREVHSDCGSLGFLPCDDGDAVMCLWCGDDTKLEELRKEYEAQKEKDEKLMSQLSKTAAILLLSVCFWACPPLPAPVPQPEPPKRALVADLDNFDSTATSTYFQRSRVLGDSTQRQGHFLAMLGISGISAWVSSAKSYCLDSLVSFQVKVDQATGDFAIGILRADRLSRFSANACYDSTEQLRLYLYRKSPGGPYTLFEYFKESCCTTLGLDLAPHIIPQEPCVLEMTYDRKLKRIHLWYGLDGDLLQEIGSEMLGESWGDSVVFVIAAHNTPYHGSAKIDWAKIEYYATPDTTTPPETHKAILFWNRNAEKDSVTRYVVEKLERNQLETRATVDTFSTFTLFDSAAFNVKAENRAGMSPPSDTVHWPQDTLR